jgi:1-acyl-sn-glycerol-3-phosphate acyltransferase
MVKFMKAIIQMDSSHLSNIHDRVVNSHQVMDAVAQAGSSLKAARKMVERMLGVQRAWVTSIVGFVISLILPLVYPMGMHIDEKSLENLKAAIAETGRLAGRDPKAKPRPVILLPTHKSHVDYLALGYMFQEKRLPMPLVVAGDNLNIPLFGSILHGGGAMFIRRSFAGDKVYSAVFNETMIELLKHNHITGCFIEGGRSRSGKLLTPKAGFMKAVVDSVLDGHVEDALLVPIAFSYGRVVEAKSMMQEMSGGIKKKEAFGDSLRGIIHLIRTTFWGAACYGSVEVSVAEAFSVREHLRMREATAKQNSVEIPEGFDLDAVQQPGTAVYRLKSSERKLSIVLDPETVSDKKTRVQLALSLGFRSLHECNRVGVIQGTALVGTILLMHKDRGLKISDLVEKVEWLRQEIVSRGGTVQSTKSVEDTVAEVVDKIMWGSGRARLVKKHKSVVMTGLFTPMETLELSTFRNNLIHLFVQDAVVAIGLHGALMRPGSHYTSEPESPTPASPESGVSRRPNDLAHRWVLMSDVAQSAQFLSVLLKHEFIYKPIVSPPTEHGSAFSDNFSSITDFMKKRDVILTKSGDNILGGGDQPIVKIGNGKQLFEFLCGLMFPFMDSYYLTLLGCYVNLTESGQEMGSLVSKIQELGENLYMNNLLDHYDAIAKDTVNNALTAFADIGILSVESPEGTRTKMLKFKVPRSEVLQTIELLHSFRKGKGKIGSQAPHQIADAIDLGRALE